MAPIPDGAREARTAGALAFAVAGSAATVAVAALAGALGGTLVGVLALAVAAAAASLGVRFVAGPAAPELRSPPTALSPLDTTFTGTQDARAAAPPAAGAADPLETAVRTTADLRAMLDAALALAGTFERGQVLGAARAVLGRRLGVARAALYARAHVGAPWRLVVAEGFSPATPAPHELVGPAADGPIVVVNSGAPPHPAAARLPAALRPAAGSSLALAPLASVLGPLGLLVLAGERGRSWDAADRALVDLLAGAMARSLDNARLLDAISEQARGESTLAACRAIQRAIVDAPVPTRPGFEVAGAHIPAGELGGDWYGCFEAADGALWVLVGDVTGHGVMAAALSASAWTACRVLGRQERPDGSPLAPAALLDQLDRVVCDLGGGTMWMTLLAARIGVDGEVTVASAGHLPPYHLRRDDDGARTLAVLATGPTPPLGSAAAPHRWGQRAVPLREGELLVLFTDGLVENAGPSGKPWGYGALDSLLRRAGDAGAVEVRDRILAACDAHTGAAPRRDDVTVVVVKATRRAAMMPP